MKKIWSYWPHIALILSAVIVVYAISRTAAFQACYASHKEYASYQQQQEGFLALKWIFRNIKVWLKCTGDWADHSHGLVTALGTLAIAIFTWTLWRSTRNLFLAGERQFLSSNRPKIRTKHVVLSSTIFEEKPITADITWINDGTSDAIIFEFGIKFYILEKGHLLPPVSKHDPARTKMRKVLEPGVSTTFDNQTDGTLVSGRGYQIGRGDLNLYCTGHVHYVDGLGRIRTTAFCRVLEFAPNTPSWVDTGRFRVFDDPDYEYKS
jgi:hypothetical protein